MAQKAPVKEAFHMPSSLFVIIMAFVGDNQQVFTFFAVLEK